MTNNANIIKISENRYKMVQIASPYNFMGNKCHIDEDMVTLTVSGRYDRCELEVNFSEALFGLTFIMSHLTGDENMKLQENIKLVHDFIDIMNLCRDWDDEGSHKIPEKEYNNIIAQFKQVVCNDYIQMVLWKSQQDIEIFQKIIRILTFDKPTWWKQDQMISGLKRLTNEEKIGYWVDSSRVSDIVRDIDEYIIPNKYKDIFKEMRLKYKYKKSSFFNINKSFTKYSKEDFTSLYKYGLMSDKYELVMAFPEYAEKEKHIPEQMPKSATFITDETSTHTRKVVDVIINDTGIVIKDKDGDESAIKVGEEFWVGNQARPFILEKKDNKMAFVKYRNNGEVLEEEDIKPGKWLMATTSGAARNGLFHKVKPLPLRIHFNGFTPMHPWKSKYDEDIVDNMMSFGEFNGLPVYKYAKDKKTYVIKIEDAYYPLFLYRKSDAQSRESQEEWMKLRSQAAWFTSDGNIALFGNKILFAD